jgi:hypothetical protein
MWILVAVGAWFVLSVPAALLVARVLRNLSAHDDYPGPDLSGARPGMSHDKIDMTPPS